jgi:hypothetical protein
MVVIDCATKVHPTTGRLPGFVRIKDNSSNGAGRVVGGRVFTSPIFGVLLVLREPGLSGPKKAIFRAVTVFSFDRLKAFVSNSIRYTLLNPFVQREKSQYKRIRFLMCIQIHK